MEKLAITLVGQGPDVSLRLKAVSYAPYALKAYLDLHLPAPLKGRVKIKALDFKWEVRPSDMASRILVDRPDIVGFSVYLWNYSQIMECAQNIKNLSSKTLIVLGGPQVSPMAEEVMAKNPYIDIISFSPRDGEITLLDIAEAAFYKRDFSGLNGITYRDNNADIVKTPAEVRLMSYETSPSPYSGSNGIFDEDTEYMAVVEASRGCPFDCGYCFWGHGKRDIEYFPLKRVLEDIEVVYNNPKVRHVYFADSNLLSNTERAEAIIAHIIKQKRELTVDFEINYIYLKESTAKLLASLTDFRFIIAIQTANPNALERIGKSRPSPERFAKKLHELKQWVPNAKHQVDIMLGLPGDDFNGFIQTLDFVLSLEPFYIVLNYPLYLLPGSRFFENRKTWGLRYSPTPPFAIVETPTFSKKEIEKAFRISIWVQIFTYYYPAIARFFYSMARSDGVRMPRLLRWIEAIEKGLDIFSHYKNLIDAVTQSTSIYNNVKKDLLEKASTTESGRIIYSSIYELEREMVEGTLADKIQLGCDIFEYLAQHKIDAVGFDSFELLPSGKVGSSGTDAVREVFSNYKR